MTAKTRSLSDVLSLMVSNLEDVANRDGFDTAYSQLDYRVSGVMISDLIYEAVSKCDVRLLCGVPYFFTGRIYEPVTYQMFDRAIEMFCKRMRVQSRDLYYSLKRFLRSARSSLDLNNELKPTFHIQAFRNGVVNMVTGVLSPFSSEFHVIYEHDYAFDSKAKCPLWNRFLKTVLPEKASRLTLQMFLGLCTFDRGTMTSKIENCLMLYGSGSNGKSVIFETVSGIFGNKNVSSMGLLPLIKGGDERLRNVAAIDGKIVNICPEIQAKDISGYEDAFKSMCSGEGQYARQIGGNVYRVTNVPWLIFNMNNMPKFSDTSHGFFRRILYVVFEYIIPEEMQNKHLADDLRMEYAGILNWIRRGGKYLKQRRYIFPKSENSEKQKLMVMAENNITGSWALSRHVRPSALVKGEISTWIKASVLHEDMVKYAEANGFDAVEHLAFGHAMTKLGFGKHNKRRTGAGVMYLVYGCTEEDLKTPPMIVSDLQIEGEDELNACVDFDEEDID